MKRILFYLGKKKKEERRGQSGGPVREKERKKYNIDQL